ncbi:MAG TPA: VCBS repeat-containing protein [Verrucomicrobiales bacterium]|nr:VCBS repeat-containing protein [Verrucomicrobiales bacterium]
MKRQIAIAALVWWTAMPELAEAGWRRHTIDRSSRGADGVRLGDLNRDGRPDLVTGWEEGGVIRVYINPGATTAKGLWPAVTVGEVPSPEDAVFVDLDGNGRLDVVSSCEGNTRRVFVHWAPDEDDRLLTSAGWKTESIPACDNRELWMYCEPMDVDGRHGIDLVIGSKGANASVSWLESPANPRDLREWKLHRIYDAGWIMSLIAHDLDDDGNLDVLLSNRRPPSAGVKWLKNPSHADRHPSTWEALEIGATNDEVMFIDIMPGHSPESMALAAAVKADLLVQWSTGGNNTWRETGRHRFPISAGTAKAVRLADIDLDGQSDLVATCEAATDQRSGVWWFRRTDNGQPAAHDISGAEGVKFDRIELLDLDDDGDLDVITCEESANLGVVWYENPTRRSAKTE